ncbi:MAG: ABC transporter permease [Deltaproteobacteria bacterium]|nr:ABC transporter permease [Deltaproteobacteria bacterium]MBW2309240.1 ABC transporter permease [Deltaproteobacteria bacterium]
MSRTEDITPKPLSRARARWELVWGHFRRSKPAIFGAFLLIVIVFSAFFAPFLGLRSITEMNLTNIVAPPSWEHPLGTDSYGRDMLARIVFGSRVSLFVGFVAVGLAMFFGIPLGLSAGYLKGRFDNALMRIMDAFFTFPPILLAIALVGILGSSVKTVIIALTIVYTPRFARIVRSSTLAVSEFEYVTASRAIGCGSIGIIFKHILPNVSGPIIVQATVTYAYAILTEASLSFLGLGVQPPTPSWGLMLSEARMYIEDSPWYPIFPGLAIVVSVLAINLFGDGLRDALDPKRQRLE